MAEKSHMVQKMKLYKSPKCITGTLGWGDTGQDHEYVDDLNYFEKKKFKSIFKMGKTMLS